MPIYEERTFHADCDGTTSYAREKRDNPTWDDDTIIKRLEKFPGCVNEFESEDISLTRFRKRLREEGWSMSGKRTLCPECARGRKALLPKAYRPSYANVEDD